MPGYFKHMEVNPKPIADTGNEPASRNWAALHQSGFMIVSHGLKVPRDTADQPARVGGGLATVGSWTSPRWGWPGASVGFYVQDVGVQFKMHEWSPDNLGGYVMDAYSQLWPFGEGTPVAAAGASGAPFGLFPLNPWGSPYITCWNCFEMHSANGLPFGLGGWPDGFGHMISQEGAIIDWGGPVPWLQSPVLDFPTAGWNGVPGSGRNMVRDFKQNPGRPEQFYVLYDSGFVYSGSVVGASSPTVAVNPADQPISGPGSTVVDTYGVPSGFRWMHVNWAEGWIIAFRADGTPWGYRLGDTFPPSGGVNLKPPPLLPLSVPWGNGDPGPSTVWGPRGHWQYGDLVPARDPVRVFLLAFNGTAIAPAVTGTIAALNPVAEEITTTTQPLINWTWNAQYAISQKSFNVRVYETAYITAQGANFVVGQNNGAVWISDRNSTFSNDRIRSDLRNGVQYRAYVRATSAADVETAWESVTFTMAIPVPSAPSPVTATLFPGAAFTPPDGYTFGFVRIAAGGSLGAGELRQYQVSVEGSSWTNLIGAEATTVSSFDHEIAPTNVALQYRVRKIKRVPGLVAGPWTLANGGASVLLPQPVGTPGGWRLIDPFSIGGPNIVVVPLRVMPGTYRLERTKPQGEFTTMSADFWKVEHTGVKGNIHTLKVQVLDRAAFNSLWGILSMDHSILFMDVFGKQEWVAADPGTFETMFAAPLSTETTGIRHAHTVDLRLLQTAPETA